MLNCRKKVPYNVMFLIWGTHSVMTHLALFDASRVPYMVLMERTS
jgi:hypothetical protein